MSANRFENQQDYVCSISPTQFEEYCQKILIGYAEKEKLPNFKIVHNVKLSAHDGTYQIDLYATYTALGADNKVICECKQYKNRVNREKIVILADKLRSLGAQKGILLSTAGFQSGAVEYAKEHGIALIQVFDNCEKWYSHSAGQDLDVDEEDPLVFGERQMPPYIAKLITHDGATNTVYPTPNMIKDIYLKMDQLCNRKYGFSILSHIIEGVKEIDE